VLSDICNNLNNVGGILFRIRIRINLFSKGVRIESLNEPFYPDADDIRTEFSNIGRLKDISWKLFSNITKMCVHLHIIKSDLHYLSCYFVLN